MKKYISLIIMCLGSILPETYAHNKFDTQISDIISRGDIMELSETYPEAEKEMTSEMLRLFAQTQLAIGLNENEKADSLMNSLLVNHGGQLGESAYSLIAQKAMNLLNLGRYGEAENTIDKILELYSGEDFEKVYSLYFIKRIGKALKGYAPTNITRPDSDISVPLKVVDAGRGKHLCTPVTVNGIEKDFIFDTGCGFQNFVSEDFAKEAGLKVVADSIPIAGIKIDFVKLAVADSMKVGEITVHNPVFLIAPYNQETDSLFQYNGVLGYNFISLAEDIVIDVENNKFIFPAKVSKGKANMYLSSNIPMARIEYENEPVTIVFDSGNVKSDLGRDFASDFPVQTSGLKKHKVKRGGFAGVQEITAMIMPSFRFKAGGKQTELKDVDIYLNTYEDKSLSGALGADFILANKKFEINYKYMFIRIF